MEWYKIDCLYGHAGRNANIGIKEHKAACKLAIFERAAVAEQVWLEGHVIEWDQVEILKRVKEALYIKFANRD